MNIQEKVIPGTQFAMMTRDHTNTHTETHEVMTLPANIVMAGNCGPPF